MKINKRLFIGLFVYLFTMSVSITVLPCGVINTHGLFGEIVSSTVTFDKDTEKHIGSRILEIEKNVKGINIYNSWFEIWMSIICMIFAGYILKLPRGDTIVTLKVRMDN